MILIHILCAQNVIFNLKLLPSLQTYLNNKDEPGIGENAPVENTIPYRLKGTFPSSTSAPLWGKSGYKWGNASTGPAPPLHYQPMWIVVQNITFTRRADEPFQPLYWP